MAIIDYAEPAAEKMPVDRIWSRVRYYAASHPLGVVGAAIMFIFVTVALFADFFTQYDPTATNSTVALAAPGAAHRLGAD
jgi:ABC-type dipeptide/oligopeptide/nickel transport system permease subunit